MSGGYTLGYEPQSRRTGVGCVLIMPAALFGTILLIEDHLYSGRWYLLAELVGWWTICMAVSWWCAILIDRAHTRGHGGYRYLLASLALVIAFSSITVGEAQPSAPNWLKDSFIALLQVIGIAALPALLAYLAWTRWSSSTR